MNFKKRFNKIYLVDSFSIGGHHEIYNAAMAIMLCRIFGKVEYYVGEGQRQSLEKKFTDESFDHQGQIIWNRLEISEKIGKKALLLRHLHSLWANIKVLIISKRKSLLIFNYNNPFALIPIKLLNLIKKQTIIIINHGELEYITNDMRIPYAKSTRLAGRLMRASLRFNRLNKRIFYLVLGRSIKINLENENLVTSSQIIALDHPYFPPLSALPLRHTIKTICIKNVATNFDTDNIIKKLATKNPELTFVVIGAVTAVKAPNIINYTCNYQIDRSEFEKILSTFDMMLFLYPNYEYRLKASGAIFDAINLGIPILSVKNDFFNDVFSICGEVGKLLDNIDQLSDNLIDNIENIDMGQLNANIQKAAQYYGVDNIQKNFEDKLIDLFIK